jgi:membrane protease YdiL (CAAX protease family)
LEQIKYSQEKEYVMKNFITRRPVWFAVAITLFDLVLGLLIFIVGSAIGLPEAALEWVALLAITAIPLILIGWLGWWWDAGFVTTTQHVPALAVPLVVALLILAWFGTVTLESGMVVRLIVAFFLTGLGEEALSRGLLLRALLPRGKWQAVLIPSVLFGLSHVTQFLFLGMSLGDNLLQIVNAALYGLLYAGVRLRVNNIWPLIILHTLGDLFSSLAGVFGVPNAIGLGGVPALFWAIRWGLLLAGGIYFVSRPATATIDGQAVG